MLGYFTHRFGIPLAAFTPFVLCRRPKTYSLLAHSSHLAAVASLKVHTVGLPVLRQVGKFLKPTTAALQTFGHLATRNRVELTAAQLEALLRAKTLPLSLTLEPGYVILACEGHLVGCGLYTPGRLHSQLPQRHVAPLRFESDD